ncbi:hypothetical protein AAEX28_15360 [Lentisphaerota bacterium WC36G]|nr:hypothetical protein LJT99_10745 [Lentisphaerae bacterium WC36]UDQ98342.1 hypothetical protein LJT99_02125 [Lentisphaerae bacterium WC36]
MKQTGTRSAGKWSKPAYKVNGKRPTKNRANVKKTTSQSTSKKSTNANKPNERQLFDRIADDHFPKHLHLKFSFYAIFDKWHEKNPSKRTESYQAGMQIMLALTAFDDLSKSNSINMYMVVNEAVKSDENWLESIWGGTVKGAEWLWDSTADLAEYLGDAVADAATWTWDSTCKVFNATVKATKNASTKIIDSTGLFLNLCVQAIIKGVNNEVLQQQYVKTFRLAVHTWKNSDLSFGGIVTLCTDLIKIFSKPLAGVSFDSKTGNISGSITIAGLKLKAWKIEKKYFLVKIPFTDVAFEAVPVISYSLDASVPFDMVFRPFKAITKKEQDRYLLEKNPLLGLVALDAVVNLAGRIETNMTIVGDLLTSGIGWVKNMTLLPIQGALANGNASLKNIELPKPDETASSSWQPLGLSLISGEGAVAPEIGSFPGPGWTGTAKQRPQNIVDLTAKIHDFGYHINDVKFFPTSVLFAFIDKYTISRKAKCDYIFNVMANNITKNFAQSLAIWVANILFSGSSPTEFVTNDKFKNVIKDTGLDKPQDYLMIPYQNLDKKYQNSLKSDRLTPCQQDTNPGWRKWAANNITRWQEISTLS